jgi:hypothetical protein
MRIILEKKDLISLLSKALGVELDDESMEVQADPFEVRISKAERMFKPPEGEMPPEPEVVENEGPNPFIGSLSDANAALVEEGSVQPRVLGPNEQVSTPFPTRGGVEQ